MGILIDIFSSIYNGLKKVGNALTSLPSLIISGCAGLIGSVVQLITSFTGNNWISGFYSQINSYISNLGNSGLGSDTANFIVWVLGVDVAIKWLIACVSLCFEILISVIVFFLIAVPAVVVPIFVVKFGLWIISALLPAGWRPSGAGGIGNI